MRIIALSLLLGSGFIHPAIPSFADESKFLSPALRTDIAAFQKKLTASVSSADYDVEQSLKLDDELQGLIDRAKKEGPQKIVYNLLDLRRALVPKKHLPLHAERDPDFFKKIRWRDFHTLVLAFTENGIRRGYKTVRWNFKEKCFASFDADPRWDQPVPTPMVLELWDHTRLNWRPPWEEKRRISSRGTSSTFPRTKE